MPLRDIFVYGGILNQLCNWQRCLKLEKEVRRGVGKQLFQVRTGEEWGRVSRDAVQSPSSGASKTQRSLTAGPAVSPFPPGLSPFPSPFLEGEGPAPCTPPRHPLTPSLLPRAAGVLQGADVIPFAYLREASLAGK